MVIYNKLVIGGNLFGIISIISLIQLTSTLSTTLCAENYFNFIYNIVIVPSIGLIHTSS